MDQPIEDGLEERAPVAFDSSDSDYASEPDLYASGSDSESDSGSGSD